ncbi:hypothetical protein RIF29_16305 [Crotalaria pallida]|uniref:Uncharacterized protein n=1 Tax=Crotalaria pallida TaxID=3830 RepID=A0AAN9FH11_CROPI
MGLGVFGSVLVLTLLFKHLASQQPNTDEFFVSEFLNKMGFHNFTSSSVCSWQRVSCKLSKLQSLDLSFNKITALPSDFWSLSSLKILNLSSNKISDSLNNIGNFGSLETFDLSSNDYADNIPEAISSLVNLRVLKLDHNMFAQNIPID